LSRRQDEFLWWDEGVHIFGVRANLLHIADPSEKNLIADFNGRYELPVFCQFRQNRFQVFAANPSLLHFKRPLLHAF
jgi:hypothetical protein